MDNDIVAQPARATQTGTTLLGAIRNSSFPLYTAIDMQYDWGVEQLLRDENIDVNTPLPIDCITPLHKACEVRREDWVAALIARGAKVNARDSRGRTPLHYAANVDALDCIKVLLENGAHINAHTGLHQTAVFLSVAGKYYSQLEFLLSQHAKTYTKKNAIPLHLAVEKSDKRSMELLLTYNANIEAKDENGNTVLHKASSNLDYGVMLMLLRAGAKPNTRDRCKCTALHRVCDVEHADWKSVYLLLEHGADINAKTMYGRTALHSCCHYSRHDLIPMLLARGADPNVLLYGSYMDTPIKNCIYHGLLKEIICLIQYGAFVSLSHVEYAKRRFHWIDEKTADEVIKVLEKTFDYQCDRDVILALLSTKVCPRLGSKSKITSLPVDMYRKLKTFFV
jgi:ankyrin repeat protein